MRHGLSGDFALMKYYSDITLIFNKKLLGKLKISCGSMIDEIAIDEPISLRKYLLAIGIKSYCYCYQEEKKYIVVLNRGKLAINNIEYFNEQVLENGKNL